MYKRQRWRKILDKTDDEIRNEACCKSRTCFSSANISFLREKMQEYLSMSTADRRKILASMSTSNGGFSFDGTSVCSIFLLKAFMFSPDLQSSVRRFSDTQCDSFSSGILESIHSATSLKQQSSHSEDHHISSDTLSKDSIVLFIDRMVEDVSEMMPDSGEFHLPFFRKEDVYELFERDYKKLYPTRSVPSISYFHAVWIQERSTVKVRKYQRFTKCDTCERIRSAFAEALRSGKCTDSIKKEQAAHNHFISLERREYTRKTELATLRPSQYLSIVVDGADQTAYNLPHFVTKIKGSRGDGMKVHLIGLLQHRNVNKLNLFTMTANHQTGANHIIECIHRFINCESRERKLPRRLFVQMDNCSRENKNQYLLSYLEALVIWKVFDIVEAGFLPVGHTHCDIDQAFSSTSDRLRYHKAVTLADLHNEVSQCYNQFTKCHQ